MTTRRSFIAGLGLTLFAAPAIVRASSLMAVRPIPRPTFVFRTKLPPGTWRYLAPYGRSPAMDALADVRELQFLENHHARELQTPKRSWLSLSA